MSNKIFNYEKSISAMVIKFIDSLGFLDDKDKASWLQLSLLYRSELDELYKIYDYISSEDLEFVDNKKIIKINRQNNNLDVNIKNNLINISIDNTKYILAGIIDILEDILPIGTIIELKPEFIKSIYNNENLNETPKFIIIRRFLSREGNLSYFPYAAVPYPIGELSDGKNIHLTSKAIDKVVYKGFSDETDLAYICVMKSEMIFKKGMHSISFSSIEEREAYIDR